MEFSWLLVWNHHKVLVDFFPLLLGKYAIIWSEYVVWTYCGMVLNYKEELPEKWDVKTILDYKSIPWIVQLQYSLPDISFSSGLLPTDIPVVWIQGILDIKKKDISFWKA